MIIHREDNDPELRSMDITQRIIGFIVLMDIPIVQLIPIIVQTAIALVEPAIGRMKVYVA